MTGVHCRTFVLQLWAKSLRSHNTETCGRNSLLGEVVDGGGSLSAR
jgi:hypothetical protein